MPQVQTYSPNRPGAIKESLLDLITNIDPTESYLLSSLKRSKATDVYHIYNTDTLRSVSSAVAAEGGAVTFGTRTNPTRVVNVVALEQISYSVSDTERAVDHVGFDDRFAYEKMKAAKELRDAMEFDLIRSTIASGVSGTSRRMRGMKASITTNATSQSGVSLSETIFNDYMKNAWQSGGDVDTILVDAVLKNRISEFTAGSTKNVAADDRRLVKPVDVYESNFGITKVLLHRHVTADNDVENDIVGIQEDLWAVAYLREPEDVVGAKVGSSTDGWMEAELTLEDRNEKGNFIGLRHR